jgi:hypothetical protein
MPARPWITIFARAKWSDVSFAGSEKSVLMSTIPLVEPVPKIAM